MTEQEKMLQIGASESNLEVMPSPSALTVDLQDVDAATTTRTANGRMHRDRLLGGDQVVRKLELEWSYPDPETVQTVLNAVAGKFVYIRYFDPYTNAMRTGYFYSGDRSVKMYSYNLHGGGVRWESLKFNMIEQ